MFYYHFSLNQLSYFLLGLGQFLFGKRHTVYGLLLLGFSILFTLSRPTSGIQLICLLMLWDLGLL